jgi:putative transposase
MAKDRSSLKRMWNIRIYPNAHQERLLNKTLAICCDLYNAALQEWRDAYRITGTSPDLTAQCRELTQVRCEMPWVRGIYQEIEANALRRCRLAIDAFFRRVKSGETPGYPRFKSKRRYDSFVYPHGDRSVRHLASISSISLPSIGEIHYRDERGVPREYTQVTIRRKNGRWYACFETKISPGTKPSIGVEIGVDVGVANLAVTSEGVTFDNPRHGERYRKTIERTQRRIAAAKKRSKRRKRLIRILARQQERLANARLDTLHKASRKIAETADVIVFEDLKIANMTKSAKSSIEEPGKNVAAKSGLNRVILDAAWGLLRRLTTYKAEEAGRIVALVNPINTSRQCSACGHISANNRTSQAEFACVSCGHAEHADLNAAKNILARYHARLGLAA